MKKMKALNQKPNPKPNPNPNWMKALNQKEGLNQTRRRMLQSLAATLVAVTLMAATLMATTLVAATRHLQRQ